MRWDAGGYRQLLQKNKKNPNSYFNEDFFFVFRKTHEMLTKAVKACYECKLASLATMFNVWGEDFKTLTNQKVSLLKTHEMQNDAG